jgi:hypothetical protein
MLINFIVFLFLESVGVCFANCTTNMTPLLLITFGFGQNNISNNSLSTFNFNTTQNQTKQLPIKEGQFAFMNRVPEESLNWHVGALDHTPNNVGGYMFIINVANSNNVTLFNSTVNDLCIGLCYEFSAYLTNLLNLNGSRHLPNVRFQVQSLTTPNNILALSNTGNISRYERMTWSLYGLSFIASERSVSLLIISNVQGGSGNDLAIDDIQLRVCSSIPSYFCSSG